MEKRRCVACGRLFKPRPQVHQQSYCSSPSCQRERRRQWQRHKLQTDPDYRDNQARAQQAWSQRNSDYWREYRESHPEYVERNRVLQHERNAKNRTDHIANMDASNPETPLPSGIYHLSLVSDGVVAKTDVWTVEITVHARDVVSPIKIVKR